MNSRIFEGWVRHRRNAPRPHAFRYRVYLMYLDLAELDELFANRWLWSAKRPALAWFRREAVSDAMMQLAGNRYLNLVCYIKLFLYMTPINFQTIQSTQRNSDKLV